MCVCKVNLSMLPNTVLPEQAWEFNPSALLLKMGNCASQDNHEQHCRYTDLNMGSLSHGNRSPWESLIKAVRALEFSTWNFQNVRERTKVYGDHLKLGFTACIVQFHVDVLIFLSSVLDAFCLCSAHGYKHPCNPQPQNSRTCTISKWIDQQITPPCRPDL